MYLYYMTGFMIVSYVYVIVMAFHGLCIHRERQDKSKFCFDVTCNCVDEMIFSFIFCRYIYIYIYHIIYVIIRIICYRCDALLNATS